MAPISAPSHGLVLEEHKPVKQHFLESQAEQVGSSGSGSEIVVVIELDPVFLTVNVGPSSETTPDVLGVEIVMLSSSMGMRSGSEPLSCKAPEKAASAQIMRLRWKVVFILFVILNRLCLK